jgi:hypothetical protein
MFGGKIGLPELLILAVIFLFFLPVLIAAWWRIFSKAGHPGVLGLTMLIPGVSFFVFLWFAFSTWPIERNQGVQGSSGQPLRMQ